MAATDRLRSTFDQLLVVGGQQRAPQGMRELGEGWYGYGNGLIIDLESGTPSLGRRFESEPGTHGEGDPVLLKSASRVGDRIYACSQTELVVFGVDGLDTEVHISHPILNDVHHVIPLDNGNLMAAVSGLDLVAEFQLDGTLVDVWGVDGSDPRDRIDADRDYRINCNLKPHTYHPNYLFRHPDGTVWVTRFETRDAVQVGDVGRRIDIGNERCHDGVVHGDRIYFTTVDGFAVEVDAETLQVVARHPLGTDRSDVLLGWCRGLHFEGGTAIVGFSRIRHTKVRGALSFVRNRLAASLPTRVARYRLDDWTLLDQLDLEPVGCNAVFSILPGRAR